MKKITASLFLLFLLIACEDSSTTSTGQSQQVTPTAGNVELCKDFDSRLGRLNQKRIELDTLLEKKDQESSERIDELEGELSNLVHDLQKDCG